MTLTSGTHCNGIRWWTADGDPDTLVTLDHDPLTDVWSLITGWGDWTIEGDRIVRDDGTTLAHGFRLGDDPAAYLASVLPVILQDSRENMRVAL